MPLRHRLAAVLVATVWGANFVAIHASLAQFPPFLLIAMRFLLVAIPTILFVPRPRVAWRWLIGCGLALGVGQFGFLYLAMAIGMPAGLASLVLQAQAPFSLILGAVLLAETVRRRQWVGIALSVLGMVLVGVSRAGVGAVLPFVLTIAGGFCWALGNLSSRRSQADNALRFALWWSVVVPVPLLILSLVVEGPAAIGHALATSVRIEAIPAWFGLLYTVVGATVLGYGIWMWLLARHPAGVVAPFSMLVPVVGLAVAALTLGEVPTPFELLGGVAVVAGVWIGSSTSRRTTPSPADPLPLATTPEPATAARTD